MTRPGVAEQPGPRFYLFRTRKLLSEFRAVGLFLLRRAGQALGLLPLWRIAAEEITEDTMHPGAKRKRKEKNKAKGKSARGFAHFRRPM